MKRFVFVLIVLSVLALCVRSAEAQGFEPNTFGTLEECQAATGYYTPSILADEPLVGLNEDVRPHLLGGCVLMDVVGGVRFVRIEPGTELVVNLATGQWVRHAECNNQIYEIVPFGSPPAPQLLRGALPRVTFGDEEGYLVPEAEAAPAQVPVLPPPPPDDGSWFSRNWKWAVPVGALVVYLGYECVTDWCQSHTINVHNTQTVTVNGVTLPTNGTTVVWTTSGFRFSW